MAKIAIIGAGPSGITAACTLQARGHDVTLYDQGLGFPREPPTSSGRRYLIAQHHIRQRFGIANGDRQMVTSDIDRLSGWHIGGGSIVWGGWSVPVATTELALASWLRASRSYLALSQLGYDIRDWPISASEFKSDLTEASLTMAMQLNPEAEQARSHPLVRGLEAKMATCFMPVFLSDSALVRYGFTHACPSRELWPWRELEGKEIELKGGSYVTDIRIDRHRKHAVGVRYFAGPPPARRAYYDHYELIGLACGAVETCRLLLISFMDWLDAPGLRNVGRCMMFHMFGPRFALAISDYEYAPLYSDALKNVLVNIRGNPLVVPGGYLTLHCRLAPVFALPKQDEFDSGRTVFELRFTGIDLPAPRNSVTLGSGERDELGRPLAIVNRPQSRCERLVYDQVQHWIGDSLRALGIPIGDTTSFELDWNRLGDHQMGGCRMGEEPAASVVSPSCQLHAVPNIIIFDGSTFPTSPGPFPTLPIVANAIRVAKCL